MSLCIVTSVTIGFSPYPPARVLIYGSRKVVYLCHVLIISIAAFHYSSQFIASSAIAVPFSGMMDVKLSYPTHGSPHMDRHSFQCDVDTAFS